MTGTQAEGLLDIAKIKNRLKNYSTKLFAVTSGKGGVGKSTFVANIAYILSSRGYKVCVLDADIGLANLQIMLNSKPKHTFIDYIMGKVKLKDIFTNTSYKDLVLVAGASGHQYAQKYSPVIFASVVEDIVSCDLFDYVIVDTGAGVDRKVNDFLDVSDNILAVTTPDPNALTDVYALIKMIVNSKERMFLAFNYTNNYAIGHNIIASIEKLMRKNNLNPNFKLEYIGNVSQSNVILNASKFRKLYTKEYPNEYVTEELSLIVDTLIKKLR